MSRATLLLIAALAGCDGAGRDVATEDAKLGPIAFEVPAEWQRINHEPTGAASAEWRPASDSNPRKESVTVVRSTRRMGRKQLEAPQLANLLASAQGSLRGAKVSAVTPLTTRRGLSGARIDVTFDAGVPSAHYRRVHAVVVDAARGELVHVLYTAASPDDQLGAFYTVLDSLHREEG